MNIASAVFFLGGLIGMALAGTLLFAIKDPPVLLLDGVFFGCAIAGFVIGGVIGSRWQRQQK